MAALKSLPVHPFNALIFPILRDCLQSVFLIAPFLIFAYLYFFISEFLWLCRVAALKSLPVHPFNALIFPILRDCLQSVFLIAPFPDLCLLVLFISEFLWLCRVAALKSLPAHPFNALIFPILRDCLQSVFLIAPFPDLCLLVLFYIRVLVVVSCGGPKKSPRTSI